MSADGKQVNGGQFTLIEGLKGEPLIIQASKLWEKAEGDVVYG